MKFKVFISSVQIEFAKERRAIAKLIRTDRLLKHFFEPYVFEETAATGKRAQKVYLDAVGECDIYLGLIGDAYGNADAEGVSPTEREYDKAVACGKERLVFVKNPSKSRSSEEGAFLDKISNGGRPDKARVSKRCHSGGARQRRVSSRLHVQRLCAGDALP